jgi:glyoxylase-like metal-dependent hydrolase (beta-lactamase superfamily II)
MTNSLTAGDFTVTAVVDGEGHLPPMFYPGADFTAHADMLDAHGTYRIWGGAYLVQGQGHTMLVDAGIGSEGVPFPEDMAQAAGLENPPEFMADAGKLPESLAAAGVKPEDVTIIVLTHLHLDHIGWVVQQGKLFFPNAEVYYGAADWDALITPVDPTDPARVVMEAAKAAGVLRPMEDASVEIVPSVTALHAPGHTPGSYIVRITSGDQRVYLTGDVIEHPLQLTEQGISFLTDIDKDRAAATRAELFSTVSSEESVMAAAHIGNPVFRRITQDQQWAPADTAR